jgi:outer membrane receptor protein involved in Fe transport
MHHTTPFLPGNFGRRLLRLAGLVALVGFATLLTARAEALKAFNVPAGPAETSLKQFSEQSGRGVIFVTSVVQGVKTAAVQGELSPRAALDLMLKDTGLVAVQDEKTGALAVKRDPGPKAPGAAPTEQSDRPGKVEDGKLILDTYQVSGQKIDGLNNKGLLQGGADAALYHDVVTRQDIERLGISSLEELFRYLPQTSSPATSLQAPSGNTSTTGGLNPRVSTVSLRGFDSGQTVILVNGRALPRSGLFNTSGPDIARIPLAAIERVEILPYSGSAIYGAGAIGGAINIILRKEFTGRDLTTYVGTSTDGGATEYRMTYLEGRTFNQGRTNLTYTISYQHRDPLRASQRGYLDEALRRYGPTSPIRNAQGVPVFEQYILSAFASSPATILVGNAPTAAVNDLGIPGAPGVRFAAVPTGTTAAQSLLLTPDSFSATAGKANLAPRYGQTVLYEPINAFSINAQLEHEFVKDKLNAYGEFTLGYNRKNYDFPQRLAFSLTATDPLNPFRTGVTPGFVGRPVTIFMDAPEITHPSAIYENEAARAVLGLKGKITETWEWSVDGTIDYTHASLNSSNPPDNLAALEATSPFASPGPAADVNIRRAVYPLLSDHIKYPISAADAAKYFDAVRYSSNHGAQSEGNMRVLGDVVELPAGPLKASTLAKYQQWDFVGGQVTSGSEAYSLLINNGPYLQNLSNTVGSRRVWQGALEVSLPVISKKWHPLPVDSFDLQGSFSRENDNTTGLASGTPFVNKQSASSSVIAGRLQVTRDIAFRGSYSEGFYPPNWGDVSLPVSTQTIGGFFPDPKRGNTLQFTPNMTILQGGNPTLRPETAKSQNVGMILTPRFLPGFSLNVDYWKIKKVDAIVSTSFVNIIANPDAYGFLITRQAPDAADPVGWLGRITAVDARAFNASVTDTDGVDVRLRYAFKTATLGNFDFTSAGSFTNKFLIAATPTAPIINTAGGSGPIRWRANGSVTWSRNAWSATVTGRYVGHRSTATNDPTSSFPGAYPLDGGRLPAYLHWDLQASYEVAYRSGGLSDWRTWVGGTKWTVGALNILNDKPAFVTDGAGFYNTADDPRQRYVYVQIKKSF